VPARIKLYCYVDESGIGQRLFIVGVIATGNDRAALIELCESAERNARKRQKWSDTKDAVKVGR
jgi:hypothetical protein